MQTTLRIVWWNLAKSIYAIFMLLGVNALISCYSSLYSCTKCVCLVMSASVNLTRFSDTPGRRYPYHADTDGHWYVEQLQFTEHTFLSRLKPDNLFCVFNTVASPAFPWKRPRSPSHGYPGTP